MTETLEGILVFDDQERMQRAVDLLAEIGVSDEMFRYAINFDQLLVVLPKAEYAGLSDIKNDLFELVNPSKSHLDGLLIDDDVHLMSWDVHTASFFELDGLEVAVMFDKQEEKDFFELPADAMDGMTEESFVAQRNLLAMKAYKRLPGYLESRRVDEFFKDA